MNQIWRYPFSEYAPMQNPQFWSFWAYFGPMDQILTKFLKSIVLQAIQVKNIASHGQKWSSLEISNFWPFRTPKTQNWPPTAPMGPRNAKKVFNHPRPVQWSLMTKNQFWKGSTFFVILIWPYWLFPQVLHVKGAQDWGGLCPKKYLRATSWQAHRQTFI